VAGTDSLPNEARELVDLVVGYAKQETVDPLKRLGKTVAFGVAGAVLVGTGGVFLSMAALRAMETETDFFYDHNLTWLPYLILTVALVAGAGISWVGLGPGRIDKGDKEGK
jgi:multisubunit Na+/H+ antiporter MnhB subunit